MRVERTLNALKHPFTEYQVQKAKRLHRKSHITCEVCGVKPTFFSRNNDVHHEIPVHINPAKACDPSNLHTLCRLHHWLVGHLMNWKDYNRRLSKTISALRETYNQVIDSYLFWKKKVERPQDFML